MHFKFCHRCGYPKWLYNQIIDLPNGPGVYLKKKGALLFLTEAWTRPDQAQGPGKSKMLSVSWKDEDDKDHFDCFYTTLLANKS